MSEKSKELEEEGKRMQRQVKLHRLKRLDQQADRLRQELGLDQRNDLVWESACDVDKRHVVEADGYGGGTYARVQDMGGCERLILDSQHFDKLEDAVAHAVKVSGVESDEEVVCRCGECGHSGSEDDFIATKYGDNTHLRCPECGGDMVVAVEGEG